MSSVPLPVLKVGTRPGVRTLFVAVWLPVGFDDADLSV